MKKARNPLFLTLVALLAIAFVSIMPGRFGSAAGTSGKGLLERTESHVEGLENYDIRTDKQAVPKLVEFRNAAGKDAVAVADIRTGFVAGEELLSRRVPSLKIEYNSDIRIPEVIAPDVKQGRNFLTSASNLKRAEILRGFVKENDSLIGVDAAGADQLKITADYTNPDGNLSFAHLEQRINGIPVFRGEIKAGFTKSGEIIRVINNLAPGLDYESLSTDFRNPLDAVKAAAGHANVDVNKLDLKRGESDDLRTEFGRGDWATTAEKMYFPTEPGVARASWRVLIWQPVNAFYVIVDAATGTMLWRKNITEDQTQSATYNVYANPNAMINVADNPFPLTPGPTSPNGAQGAAISRTSVTRIGNEAPYTFNNNGWITDGGNETDGNANEAGLDRDSTNGVDVTNGRAVGTSRTFNFPVNPLNPNTNTGDTPIPAGEVVSPCASIVQPHGMNDAQRAAVTQLFYINNWYHDELYRLGFTEQARNFQGLNFGRGGSENDRVSAEAQDCSGTNNANFSTPADGARGRMQMYLWTGPTPDIDGDFDAEVIIHEHTHGLSNRLHGNGSGLSTNMSRGMGEGWSDFYAHALLSEPTDPINGIYTAGGYDTYLIQAGFVNNYYYGIRRFPKAVKAFTGGAGNLPYNPMTFADVDSTQFNVSDGAFARGPVGSATVDQVHNLGEIWSTALWEVRAKLVTRLGWATGNRLTLQLVTDGMKLAPVGPTFLQERDAIIAAAQASSAAPEAAPDVADVWAGFAIRGMGFSAVVTNAGTGASNTRVTEAFDLPNLVQTPTFTVSDSTGDNDGFPEPGEPVSLSIPLSNNTGNTATGVTLQVVGGGSANIGTINNGQTVAPNVAYTIAPGTPCGSVLNLTFNVNSSLGATSFNRSIIVGQPITSVTENFDGVTAPAFPVGWTAAVVQNGQNFVTSTNFADSAPNSAFAVNPATVGGGSDLTSPTIAIVSPASTVSFRNRYDTEPGWDGGALEISIAGGAFQDIIAAGGAFVANGYNGTLGAGTNNPLANRAAWNGNSNGFVTSTVRLPASAAGQNVQLKWRFGADDNTVGQGPNPGWYVDNVAVVSNYACSFTPNAVKSRGDFDGDGKTDVAVFRASESNWYLNRSTAGFAVVNFGLATDTLTPADWDGDGKADPSVFRPVATSGSPDFWILQSGNNTIATREWGTTGDTPQVGDYDGDGNADAAVFRSATNTWFILKSGGGTTITGFGAAGDVPVRADYDGDGKTDIAIFRPSSNQWWISNSTGPVTAQTFGAAGDKLVPADYDGDNKDDIAIWRPSTAQWWIIASSTSTASATTFGIPTDTPVPGDYDGDGKDDLAIYRSGSGQWWLNRSTAGVTAITFGIGTDTPIPTLYIP
ncbi:MAG: M36 family metallopeptidase [Acidobacteria bacterium]|nr:M36 family metallopeptidase [Acidobacteriota bacterium]